MRLGVSVGYFGMAETPNETLHLVREAESIGYATAWVGEPYGNDAVSVLGWLAAGTERIRLGSGILAMPGRTPAMTGQTAATLDLLSGGRLVLGLGSSGPQVSEGWHGVPFAGQLQRTREYVEIVRKVLRRERLEHHGEVFELPLPGGEGKPLKLILHPPRPDVPIHLAAIGPRNTALCGEIADGWLPLWYSPDHAGMLHAPLAEGAARSGRRLDEIEVAPSVTVRIDDDLSSARELMRPALALYVGGMGSRRRNFYNALIGRYGYEDVARAVQDRYLDGDPAGAAALLPDALIDELCLCGPVERIADRLSAYREAGVDELVVIPVAWTTDDRIGQLQLAARAAERSGAVV